ncbi:MAG: thiolase family protein [Clostridiales bacterium]|nr:thiolase family protein [Clostridiales bacterium]
MNEAWIVAGVRTPIGKAPRGTLRGISPLILAELVVREAVRRAGVPPEDVEDVILGCALPEAEQGLNIARLAALKAGLPTSVGGMTVNRFCSSGLQSIAIAAHHIQAGTAHVMVAGGVESMSRVPMVGYTPSPDPGLTESWPEVYISMGQTAEEVAQRWGISREDMDRYSLESHRRAHAATEEGRFKDEIIPVPVPKGRLFPAPPNGLRLGVAAARQAAGGPVGFWERDGRWPEKEDPETVLFEKDEGIRPDTSMEALAKLRPAFRQGGSVTAGNSSQTSDGAAAVVVVSSEYGKAHGLKPRLIFRSFAVAGVDPEIMGVGPLKAVPKALAPMGLKVADLDVIELNEAFASQTLAVIRGLEMDPQKVNPNGGAIALGHPLGATGARQTVTLMHELERRNGRFGLVTMCIGGGMGAAGLFERPS